MATVGICPGLYVLQVRHLAQGDPHYLHVVNMSPRWQWLAPASGNVGCDLAQQLTQLAQGLRFVDLWCCGFPCQVRARPARLQSGVPLAPVPFIRTLTPDGQRRPAKHVRCYCQKATRNQSIDRVHQRNVFELPKEKDIYDIACAVTMKTE